jgi:hypothetical protein
MPIALKAIRKGTARTKLEDIEPDVIEAVEEAYQHCLLVPDERIEAAFDSQDAADDFLTEARAYAYQRKAGRVVITGNTTKHGAARFRVETYVKPASDDKPDDEPETEE